MATRSVVPDGIARLDVVQESDPVAAGLAEQLPRSETVKVPDGLSASTSAVQLSLVPADHVSVAVAVLRLYVFVTTAEFV